METYVICDKGNFGSLTEGDPLIELLGVSRSKIQMQTIKNKLNTKFYMIRSKLGLHPRMQ